MTDADRIALRRIGGQQLDDVFVNDVEMFRAEMLDRGRLWLCCYLRGTGVEGDRVTFEVVARGKSLEFNVVEMPQGTVQIEAPE